MLEAFLFKIEYKNKTKQDGILTDVKKVLLNKDDVKFLKTLCEREGKSLKHAVSRYKSLNIFYSLRLKEIEKNIFKQLINSLK